MYDFSLTSIDQYEKVAPVLEENDEIDQGIKELELTKFSSRKKTKRS